MALTPTERTIRRSREISDSLARKVECVGVASAAVSVRLGLFGFKAQDATKDMLHCPRHDFVPVCEHNDTARRAAWSAYAECVSAFPEDPTEHRAEIKVEAFYSFMRDRVGWRPDGL